MRRAEAVHPTYRRSWNPPPLKGVGGLPTLGGYGGLEAHRSEDRRKPVGTHFGRRKASKIDRWKRLERGWKAKNRSWKALEGKNAVDLCRLTAREPGQDDLSVVTQNPR